MDGSVRVLHVDDYPGFCKVLAEYLENIDDRFEVISEHGVEDALDRFDRERETTDCVVSDYQMPETNGIEFLHTLRERYPDFATPFVLLTGEGSEAVAAEALNAGASSYVQKGDPEVFEYLAERIRHDIRAARDRRDSRRFGALVRALGDPVYALDSDGRFTYVNQAFVDLVGYDRAEIIGSHPSLIKDEGAVETAEEHLGRLLSEDGPEDVVFELEVRPADGDPVRCEDHMSVLPYDGDRFRGSLGVLREVPDRRRRRRDVANRIPGDRNSGLTDVTGE